MQVYMKWQWVVQQILDPLIHHNPFHIILNPSKATIVNLTLPSFKEDHLKCSFMPKMYGITHKGWGCNDDQKLVPLNNLNLNFSVYITIVIWTIWLDKNEIKFSCRKPMISEKKAEKIPYSCLWNLMLCG